MFWPGLNIFVFLSTKFSFALYTSNDNSSLWKKQSFGWKMLVLSKMYQWSRLKGFWSYVLTQARYAKSYLHKNIKFGTLAQLNYFIFYQRLEKWFEVIENVNKLKFEGDWAELRPKVCLLKQSRTKYLEQNREIL